LLAEPPISSAEEISHTVYLVSERVVHWTRRSAFRIRLARMVIQLEGFASKTTASDVKYGSVIRTQ
jgi:hypothetical protein